MRKLYAQIYLSFVGVALLCVLVAGVTSHLLGRQPGPRPYFETAVRVLAADLPAAHSLAAPDLRHALGRLAERLEVRLSLWNAEGKHLASSGTRLLGHKLDRRPGWFYTQGRHGILFRLDDGRWLAASPRHDHTAARFGRFLLVLGLLLGAIALGSYGLARRITRRLERLQRAVESWGAGDLATRVQVRGSDEVAQLSRSFNWASARIESLLAQQRRVLASASHELRSPLARLSVGVELLSESDIDPSQRAKLRRHAERDVRELDALIGDVLLASRLQDTAQARQFESLELLALVREEASKLDAKVHGKPLRVSGEGRMLRRLVRNLFDNARRHGGGEQIEAFLEDHAGSVRFVVADRGKGVPEALRERIFEPFYRPAGHREGHDGGVGLGLALVRQIAEFHDGRAHYEPREGGGSQFVVTLPIADASG